ncbi:hypothetical protein OY671_012978, partial [Metschnikowia pulcherrima]
MQSKSSRDVVEFTPGVRKRVAAHFPQDAPPEVAIDQGWKLSSNERPVRFKEMEYHVPIERQVEASREVVRRIENQARDVFVPIEARIIAPDDAWLSPFYQRESGSIAVHAYYKDSHQFMFDSIEP